MRTVMMTPCALAAVMTTGLLTTAVAVGCGRDEPAYPADHESASAEFVDEPFCVEGTILEASRSASVVLIQDLSNRMWSVSMATRPSILVDRPAGGSAIDLLPGLPVAVCGRRSGRDSIRPDSVRVLEMPAVVLVSPRAGVSLTRPVIPLEGYTRRGAVLSYRLLDGEKVLTDGRVPSEVYGARAYGAFRYEIAPQHFGFRQQLSLEVWVNGSEDEPVRRSVRFARDGLLTLYFPSLGADPERRGCENVYPVSVAAPVLLPPDSIVAMLIGEVPFKYRRRGLFSELSRFREALSVGFEDGVVTVDLRRPEPGTEPDECSRTAALAQLTRTLGATLGVDSIMVTVEGAPL